MSPKASRKCLWLAVASGAAFVFSFIPFYLVPLLIVFPVFLNLISLERRSLRSAFFHGFLVSAIINGGGFWWMVYTIHEFGYLPWSVSALIFLVFCGFGALNFPLYVALATAVHQRVELRKSSALHRTLWLVVGLPALFTVLEYAIPKLFPFYAGHALYFLPVFTQISELTGSVFLSFLVVSLGGALTAWWLRSERGWPLDPRAAAIPVVLLAVTLGFGAWRLSQPAPHGKKLRVGLVQANIGSLEKVSARKGIQSQVRYVLDKYRVLTEQAVASLPRPDLIVWPETAVPFQLMGPSHFAEGLRNDVLRWKIPLITGAYAPHETDPFRDYNAAYLLSPENGGLRSELYRKNVLLAFGEYFPGGDAFPVLYRWFPQVSNFGRGTDQKPVRLADGTRVGITICYEAIIPSFFRRVVAERPDVIVNLTNDSWFGPTTEPEHHGALAVFRTVETRLPLVRVTNTGISFTVDTLGRRSERTGVYEEGLLLTDVLVPSEVSPTFYTRFGDWFVALSALLAAGLWRLLMRERRALVSVHR